MHARPWNCLAVVLALAAATARAEDKKPEPVSPTGEVVKLFNGNDLTGLSTWLKASKRDDPKKVFTVRDGLLHVSGEDSGYVATERAYRDYRLVVEYRWGKNTFGSKTVRNSGVLLHGTGADGGAGGVWMPSIECQLAQGCVGDLIPIRGIREADALVATSFSADTVFGPDKHPRWKKGGEMLTFTKGQLWWSLHDPDYKELIDTRGKDDVESPLGEWTRVECVCDGKRITVSVNGTVVNECYDAYPSAGKVLLQSEGFEMDFRTFELHPLKKTDK